CVGGARTIRLCPDRIRNAKHSKEDGSTMEQVKITSVDHFRDDDFDELIIRLDGDAAQNSVAEIADDLHNAYLQLDPNTNQVVGSTIVDEDDWFAEIAAAFQNKDMSNPDVRFFLEQKIKSWVLQHHTRLQPVSTTN